MPFYTPDHMIEELAVAAVMAELNAEKTEFVCTAVNRIFEIDRASMGRAANCVDRQAEAARAYDQIEAGDYDRERTLRSHQANRRAARAAEPTSTTNGEVTDLPMLNLTDAHINFFESEIANSANGGPQPATLLTAISSLQQMPDDVVITACNSRKEICGAASVSNFVNSVRVLGTNYGMLTKLEDLLNRHYQEVGID